MFLCLTARGLKSDLQVVARAYDQESLAKLRRAGATHAISPTLTGAVRIAATLLRPTVVSFLDAITVGTDISLRLEETEVTEGSALIGQTLADARIPQKTGLVVLALRSGLIGKAKYNPGPETRLAAHDVMIVLGEPDQVQKLREYVSG